MGTRPNRVTYSVIVPCYNTQPIFVQEVQEIYKVFHDVLKTDSFELILVNDCSPNPETLPFLKKLKEKWNFITLIDLMKNTGQANAQLAALNYVSGDIIINLDDDMQTHPKNIPLLLNKMEEGYDVVLGKYVSKRHNAFRRLLTSMDNCFETVFIGRPKHLSFTSFWAAKRAVTDTIRKYIYPYSFMEGLFLRTTANITNVEMEHFERQEGHSGYNFRSLLRLWSNFTNFTVKPLRISIYLGLLAMFAGLILAIVTIINKILYPGVPAGYTTLVCLITLLFGVTLLIMGVMGEYIGRIFMCINASPQYIVRDIYKSKEEETENEQACSYSGSGV